MQTRDSDFRSWISSECEPFDKIDLASRIGALMLDPANIRRTGSLELIQSAVCCSSGGANEATMSPTRFRRMIAYADSMGLAQIASEDPQENVFSRLVHGESFKMRGIVGPSTDLPDTDLSELRAQGLLDARSKLQSTSICIRSIRDYCLGNGEY